jgi:uncharacterized protein
MSIEKRVLLVEELFQKLDVEISEFKVHTKLSCMIGCGKCCNHPEIDASPLEFLPWAFHLFLNGEAEKVLMKLNKETSVACFNYKPLSLLNGDNGKCSNYQHRGLICRLFGFGANTDKYGKLRLATCKIIKEGQAENYNKSTELINKGLPVPIFTDYYMNLAQIDFLLGNVIVPINKALKLAIEEVLQYYAYRPMPSGHFNCA